MSPRPNKFRFYLDENFPAPAGKFLKTRGHNVLHVIDLPKFRSKSDLIQIRKATKEKRILVALDKDFLGNKNLENAISNSFGVLLVSSADPGSSKVIEILKQVIKLKHFNNLKGKLCIASIDKINII